MKNRILSITTLIIILILNITTLTTPTLAAETFNVNDMQIFAKGDERIMLTPDEKTVIIISQELSRTRDVEIGGLRYSYDEYADQKIITENKYNINTEFIYNEKYDFYISKDNRYLLLFASQAEFNNFARRVQDAQSTLPIESDTDPYMDADTNTNINANIDTDSETDVYTEEQDNNTIKNEHLLYDQDGIVIEDSAELLEEGDVEKLVESMKPITEYGKVGFVTGYSYGDTREYADLLYSKYFGTNSGVLFLIDMNNREIYIMTDGEAEEKLTTTKAYSITDNVYQYATNGEYAKCGIEAFKQAKTVLDGKFLFTPLRYITGALLGFGCAIIIGVVIVNKQRDQSYDFKDLTENTETHELIVRTTHTHTTKTRNSSSSGGSGGGGGGGGGRSGGGHRF